MQFFYGVSVQGRILWFPVHLGFLSRQPAASQVQGQFSVVDEADLATAELAAYLIVLAEQIAPEKGDSDPHQSGQN
jgi:hypothetical protein